MTMDMLGYSKLGFIPNEHDDEPGFQDRVHKTIDRSNLLKDLIRTQSPYLADYFCGNLEKLVLNPHHDNGCRIFNDSLGMYPSSFVGLINNMTDVYPSVDDNPVERTRYAGVKEVIRFIDIDLPIYTIKRGLKYPPSVSVHELFHCTSHISRHIPERMRASHLVEHLFEEFRAELAGWGRDFSIEGFVNSIPKNADLIVGILENNSIRQPLEDFKDPVRLRKAIYRGNAFLLGTHSIPRKYISRSFLAGIFTGSLSIPLIFLPINPFLQALGIGTSAGLGLGFMINSAMYRYANYRISKGFNDLSCFMSEDRERLKEEFGKKGADFLAYSLHMQEIKGVKKALRRNRPVKDYLHGQKTLRSKMILDHTLNL